MSDSDIIAGIAEGDKRTFEDLYWRHRRPFVSYLRHSQGVSTEDALDIYQDACAALHNNIVTGRLTPESLEGATLKTYLFAVGTKILFNRRRKKQTDILFDTEAALKTGETLADDDPDHQERLAVIRLCVKQMKSPCKELLSLRLWTGLSSAEIAARMNYSSDRSAITQVSKCRQKLISYVKSQLKGYDDR